MTDAVRVSNTILHILNRSKGKGEIIQIRAVI